MDVFGYVLFGVVFAAALVITYLLDRVRKRYVSMTVIHALERDINLQGKVKGRFGWK